MRSNARKIATAAFAGLLMGVFTLHAENAAAGAKDEKAGDSSAASAFELEAPMPAAAMSAAMPYSRGLDRYTPRVEWFLGYSYLRAVPAPAAGNRLVWLNGGSTSLAFNFNRHWGLVGDFGGFNDTQLLESGGNPSVVANSSGKAFTYLLGPRFSFRNNERITPFAQVLFGDIHAGGVTLSSNCTGLGCTPLPAENSFALTAGGGLDINVHRHFAIRILQAEYLMTRFANVSTGASASQNDIRLSAGLVFRFGGNPAPPLPAPLPLSYSCSVNPAAVFPGEPIAASGTAVNLDPARTAVYTWSADGGAVAGSTSTATIDTTTAAVGSYTLKGHVSEGDKPGENADCSAAYGVKALEPPTVSCLANPSTVNSGDPATITATGVSPQNHPLTYSYSSTSGSVSGSGTTAILATGGVAAGSITVTCSAVDDKNQTASGTTTVTVVVPQVALPVTSELCSISFARDAHRPSRVDNEAKACLDQVALNLQRESDSKLALIGNAVGGEKGGSKLAAERAVNAKAYLVGEKGIDSTRIAVYTGSQDGKIVSTTLIPEGAHLDATGDTPVR
jgi:hypothetical protein